MPADSDDESLFGLRIDAIDTPAMIVDLDILEANLKLMADYFADRHCKIRPHFKSHKCVELARRQMQFGNACGITCAKLSEAEQLVAGGIDDVLIANQVIGDRKTARLAKLNQSAVVRCAVDSVTGIEQLDRQGRAAETCIPVLVEVDIGMKRCGVQPGMPTLELVKEIADRKHVRFDGLQGYEGHLVCIADQQERRDRTTHAMEQLIKTKQLLQREGIPVSTVSGGSSSTYDTTGDFDEIDELQCGSYALMDWSYQELRPEFQIARWILTSVVSKSGESVVADVGLKGIACDFGPPRVEGFPDAIVRYTAEEHIPLDHVQAAIGQQLRLVPSHGCTTSSLHRQMWITRDDVIVDVWPIEGAGSLE